MSTISPIRTWKQDALYFLLLIVVIIFFVTIMFWPNISGFISKQAELPATIDTSNSSFDTNSVKQNPDIHEVTSESELALSEKTLQELYIRASIRDGVASQKFPRWAIVTWNSDGEYSFLTNEVVTMLVKSGNPRPLELFTDSFLKDGLAEQIMTGKEDLLFKMNLDEFVDYLILGFSEERALAPGDYENIKSVQAMIKLRIYSMSDDKGSLTLQANDVGTGFNQLDASQQAIKIVLEKIQVDIISQISGL